MLPIVPRDKPLGPQSQLNSTSSFGFLTGNVFSSTASTRLNNAVLAPMPSASESTAITVNALLFSSILAAYFRSCTSDPIPIPPLPFGDSIRASGARRLFNHMPEIGCLARISSHSRSRQSFT